MSPPARSLARTGGVVLRGRLWPGGDHDPARPVEDGVVVVGADGSVVAAGEARGVDVPDDRPSLGGPLHWIGPGVTDAHVHLGLSAPELLLAGGVVAARDLGAPVEAAAGWAAGAPPMVTYAGEILTATGGYPSASWGAGGYARFADDPGAARAAVAAVVARGASVVKLALEPRGGPVPDRATAAAVVEAAHALGRPVVAHALTVAMVERALDAGVDELAHAPAELLPAELVARLAAAGATVTGTLATFAAEPAQGDPSAALANVAALLAAGVPVRYGTDLGNAGTRPGVDPRELALLARAGLGPAGALRAACAGWPGVAPGTVSAGAPAAVVLLDADPLADPRTWRRVAAVVAGGQLRTGGGEPAGAGS
ncbi:MAG: amidohydrolase family protein [Frankiaceae bacterium]